MLSGRSLLQLVAASVVLPGDQSQSRADSPVRPGSAAEQGKHAEDQRIGAENAQAERGEDGNAENDRHEKRNHDLGILRLGRLTPIFAI